MAEDQRLSGSDRREARDRRRGVDTRSVEERRVIGERRSNKDQRSGLERRSNPAAPTSPKNPRSVANATVNRSADGVIDDRRKSVEARRLSPRTRTLKGAQIFWPSGAAVIWPSSAVKCVVRNLSEIGAKIEVYNPVPATFEIVFDLDHSRRSCRVVWRKGPMVGVKFL